MKEITEFITEMKSQCKNCFIITYVKDENNPEPKVTYQSYEDVIKPEFWKKFINDLGDNEADKYATPIINRLRLAVNNEGIFSFSYEDIEIIVKNAADDKYTI